MKSEAVTVLVAIVLLVVPPWVAGRIDIASLMGTMAVLFGLWELWSIKKHGKTISKLFWAWAEDNRGKSFVVLGLMELGWTLLMMHLAFKV